jgi:hypothetical protein
MHNLSLEVFQPFNLRIPRLVQLPNRRHQKVAVYTIRFIELRILTPRYSDIHIPPPRLIVPARLFHTRVEPNVLVQPVLLRHFSQLIQNLLLARVLARPIRILLKRVAVQHGPDVAAAPGVLVVVPCSANGGGFLKDDEVLERVAF